MKKSTFIFLFALLSQSLTAQIIGGNGEGFGASFQDEDIRQITLLSTNSPIGVRWPGGGDSKVAFPAIDKPGLGMNINSVNALYDEFRDGQGLIKVDALEKDIKKAEKEKEATESELMHLIRTSRATKNFQVSFALNVMQGTPESNLRAITTLIDSGVNIVAVVAGNETFASYNYNWEKYKNDFEPILKAIQKKYPDIPRLLCIGQAINRKTHIQWNTQLFQYVKKTGNFISGVDIHYYLYDELKEANATHPGMVQIKEGKADKQLDKAFAMYIEAYRNKDQMSALAAYLQVNLPGKIYHCSEFGDKEAENWSNTVANGAHIFTTFCVNRNSFDMLLVHNLIGNWLWAARRPATKLDDVKNKSEKVNRISWYALQLANELPATALPLDKTIKIIAPGKYYYYYDNAGGELFNHEITSTFSSINYELHYVTGKFPYSSAGSAGFWAKNSQLFFEVKGITIDKQKNQLSIPKNSFGYVQVVVE
ncbi:MAG: hypothetical protein V9F05_06390 [Chitinophagaceae bacterium]